METVNIEEPKRILSGRIVARRLGVSPETISKHIRRKILRPDYASDVGVFFNADRLPELRKAIAENRQKQWRHISAAT